MNLVKIQTVWLLKIRELYSFVDGVRGCLGLFHKLCSTNSTVEQLHKKLEFVEYLSLGVLTTPPFFLELSAWSWNRLAKKRGAKLKNVEQSSPKLPP